MNIPVPLSIIAFLVGGGIFLITWTRACLARDHGAIGPQSYGRASNRVRLFSLASVLWSVALIGVIIWSETQEADVHAAYGFLIAEVALYIGLCYVTFTGATRQLRQFAPSMKFGLFTAN
jgi:hypothetical protein